MDGRQRTVDGRADDWKVGCLEGWTLDGKTEGRRTEDGGRKTEDRGLRTEGRRQQAEDSGPMHNGFKNS